MSAKSNTKGNTVKRTPAKKAKAKEVQQAITRGFKGFDKDMRCRGFQFEPGKTFTEECDPKICKRGFHFCEYPLDIFNYYPPAGSRFCMVETPCVSQQTDGDTKRVTKTLTIGAEIDIAGLVKSAFEYTWTRTTLEPGNSASGMRGAAQAYGDYSVALAAGYEAKAKGKLGCAICCVEREDWQTGKILAVKSAIVDGEIIKADTWYTLRGGEFVEVAA